MEKTIADEGKCRSIILDFDKHVDAGLSSLLEREGLGDVMTPSELLKPISVKNIRLIVTCCLETEQESNLLFKTATNPDGTATVVINRLEGAVKENGDGGDWENKKEKTIKKRETPVGYRKGGGSIASTGEEMSKQQQEFIQVTFNF